MRLLISACVKFLLGVVLVGVLVFLPAGTLHYAGGWLLMGILFVPMSVLGVVLFLKSPALLRERLASKEKESAQKSVVAGAAIIFLAGFIVAGLDARFSWSAVPTWVTAVATILFLCAYGLYAEVMRENAYLSRTIKVQEGQTVVDTGLYGIVRHPMYAVTVLLFCVIPLVLGSWYALIPFGLYPLLMVARIRNEEQVLCAQLNGYMEYQKRVKYRLIPFVW